ncbi:helix-turn-helix domain-containing protein [Micromonospora sp. NPDC049801]|uniref:helix-turn-helix domain-containing protein n=1 Tax=unclassified Micromonospora TaxID=2617518 RepID=UPI0033E8942B
MTDTEDLVGRPQLTDQQMIQLLAILGPLIDDIRARLAADRWLTIPQLAEHLQVSAEWVKRRAAAREIPHHRVGKQVRFTPADLSELEEIMKEPALNSERDAALALTRLRVAQQRQRRPRRQ